MKRSLGIKAKPSAALGEQGGVKTLIENFRYPRKGPGMMWESAAQRTRAQGGEIRMGCRVNGAELLPASNTAGQAHATPPRWRVHFTAADGTRQTVEADHVISSAPLKELVKGLKPPASAGAVHAAESLKYRDFLTVALIVRPSQRFDDNWIYIHEPGVKVGRVQNFASWSPELVPDPELACYGLEYFCFEGDGLWNSTDEELIELGGRELVQLGLAKPGDVIDGHVVRQPKAYPVYDDDYATHVATIRHELDSRYPNLHLVGRNGMHKYNNQDHAMMTAMLVSRNILAGESLYDIWDVNQDAEYHEAGDRGAEDRGAGQKATGAEAGNGSAGASGLRQVPQRIAT
jgi:protoporphyrinogen oxidase